MNFSDGLLAADKEHDGSPEFRKFRRQLQQISLGKIFAPTKLGMSRPKVRRCPDKHFYNTIMGFGAEICDYPDQVGQSCTIQGWCVK